MWFIHVLLRQAIWKNPQNEASLDVEAEICLDIPTGATRRTCMRRNHAHSAVRACVRLPWQPSVLEWSIKDGFPYTEGNSADSETAGRRPSSLHLEYDAYQ